MHFHVDWDGDTRVLCICCKTQYSHIQEFSWYLIFEARWYHYPHFTENPQVQDNFLLLLTMDQQY